MLSNETTYRIFYYLCIIVQLKERGNSYYETAEDTEKYNQSK